MDTYAQRDPTLFSSRMPPKSILAPVDFSDCSLAGLAAAKSLALRWDSRVEIVHADAGLPAELAQGMDLPEERRRVAEYYGALESRLQGLRARIPQSLSRLCDGDAAEVLSKLAAVGGFDLVVMGTHGRRGVERLLLGSVAERVVHASRVPVLTVHHEPGPGWPGRILIPMKYTNYADRALLCALDWAKNLGASLSVMHVVEDEEHGAEEDNALDAHMKDLVGTQAFDKLGRIVYRGEIERSILSEAKIGNFDLVILAEHFRSYWRDMLVGTTAERVVRLSQVPVLSVPALSGF